VSLFTETTAAIDGSKFKAANNCDKNFTSAKMERRMAQIEESVACYLAQLDGADRQEPRRAHNQDDPLMPRLSRTAPEFGQGIMPRPGILRAAIHRPLSCVASCRVRQSRDSRAKLGTKVRI
jgi:hypothetical protein